jgi:hypothetical protein
MCVQAISMSFKMLGSNALSVIAIKPEEKYDHRLHSASMLFALNKIFA